MIRAALLILAFSPLIALGQGIGANDDLTVESLKKLLERLDTIETLSETERSEAKKAYGDAIEYLNNAEKERQRLAQFESLTQAAPAAQQALEEKLAKPTEPVAVDILPNATPADLEQSLVTARAEETARQRALEDLRGEPARREGQRAELATAIAADRKHIGELEDFLKQPATPDVPPGLAAARRARQETALVAARRRLAANEAESTSYERRTTLITLRIQEAERAAERAAQTARAWQEALDAAKRSVAEAASREAERARRAAANSHPVIRELTDSNAALTRETEELTRLTGATRTKTNGALDYAKQIEEKMREARRRIDAVGLTDAIGLLLRQHRDRLPSPRDYRQRIAERRSELEWVQTKSFSREDEIQSLDDLDVESSRRITSSSTPVPENQADFVTAKLRELLTARKSYLDAYVKGAESYTSALVALDTAELEVIEQSSEYTEFIDERVLWIRSAKPLWETDAFEISGSVAWLTSPREWKETGAIAFRVLDHWLVVVIGLIALAVLLYARRRLDTRSVQSQASKGTTFMPTLAVSAAAILHVIPIPLLFWAISSAVENNSEPQTHARGIGAALKAAAMLLFILASISQVYRKGGLAEAHFGWRGGAVQLVRRNLRWFIWVSIPAMFFVAFFRHAPEAEWHASSGRIALVVFLISFTILLGSLLKPDTGLLCPALRGKKKAGWLTRLRWTWFLLATGVPLTLAFLAVLGYQFTALELVERLELTIGLVGALVIVDALISRALVIARRRLLMQQKETTATIVVSEERGIVAKTEKIDVDSLNAQSRQLLKTAVFVGAVIGGWLIWVDVLPALGILRDVDLWSNRVVVVENVTAEDTTTHLTEVARDIPVTLADLMTAMIVLTFTVLATKNLPGVLEVALLQQLPLEQPSRYAMTTVARYMLAIVGVTVAFGQLGVSWQKVQWLVAAMSVGLGFGLQEIFGNFVSGLIILFERRVRVGDIVTVGDVTGTVRRVRVLATTVENWDRKELVVPNKNLVTGSLLNWTLSSSLNRVVINVGIAYGSDTSKAREILLRLATNHPMTLVDPPAVVTFDSFGDSSLLMVLRVFLATLDYRLRVITELNESIDAEFKKAGIEIAFPQRDIHIRTAPTAPQLDPLRSEPPSRDGEDRDTAAEGADGSS